MSGETLLLNDFYIDAVFDVLNVGMGSAAASLSEMTGEVIKLSVPKVKFISRSEAANIIEKNHN